MFMHAAECLCIYQKTSFVHSQNIITLKLKVVSPKSVYIHREIGKKKIETDKNLQYISICKPKLMLCL